MKDEALKELLYKMADDLLVMGHRNSEWTGMGPLLEEDIAFSSMAQDQIGQSLALYTLLHQLGEQEPDTIAFTRNAGQFHNCILTELPNLEYDFSLIRHFLFDTAQAVRFGALSESEFQPLAELSVKIKGELRYHTLHANTWVRRLGSATEESIARLQRSLDEAAPYVLGIFEQSPMERVLIESGIFIGEDQIRQLWKSRIDDVLKDTRLRWPANIRPIEGGRTGNHSEHLQPMLDEMSEVFRIDPGAEW